MVDCRCAWECSTCRWDRLGYTGCKCPGCAPTPKFVYQDYPNQSPVEYARTIGIIYRKTRGRICDARRVVAGELVQQFPK